MSNVPSVDQSATARQAQLDAINASQIATTATTTAFAEATRQTLDLLAAEAERSTSLAEFIESLTAARKSIQDAVGSPPRQDGNAPPTSIADGPATVRPTFESSSIPDIGIPLAKAKVKTVNLTEFVRHGYLQELNRMFLHPLGLALACHYDQAGNVTELGPVWDFRDDADGVAFMDTTSAEAAEKAMHVEQMRVAKQSVRRQGLGWDVQPIGSQITVKEPDVPTTTT